MKVSDDLTALTAILAGWAEQDDDSDNDAEALNRRWKSPGATPGIGDASAATNDALIAARDQSYAEYLDRLNNGWRR
jgi:hypothetical protein